MIEARLDGPSSQKTPSVPNVDAEWKFDLRLSRTFDIRDYLVDLGVEECREFLEIAKTSGTVPNDLAEYLTDDINDAIWDSIQNALRIYINEAELGEWITHCDEHEER